MLLLTGGFSLTTILTIHLMQMNLIEENLSGNLYKIGGIMLIYDKIMKINHSSLKEN